jgi:hypothetical protein
VNTFNERLKGYRQERVASKGEGRRKRELEE